MDEEIKKNLFDQKLFMEGTGEPILKGSKCLDCNRILFPARSRCPECLSSNINEIPLGKKGSLYSYTTVYIPSKNFEPPYTVGYVELEEGVRIFGQIDIEEDQALQIGLPMKVSVDYLWNDQDGQKVSAYFFQLA